MPRPKGKNGESIGGYFRKLFRENPRLLHSRSNEEVLKRWLADHPGHKEMPANVRNNMSNVKSTMRSKRRGRKRARVAAAEAAGTIQQPQRPPGRLGVLEEQIDDVLAIARTLDRTGLETVISLLRRARNEVVWKMGQ